MDEATPLGDLFAPSPVATDAIPPAPPARRTRGGREGSRQAELGQFLTRPAVAAFMAGLFPPGGAGPVRLLDAGAGRGALTEAFVRAWRARGGSGPIDVHAHELDPHVLGPLRATAEALEREAGARVEVVEGDFVERASAMARLGRGPRYTHAILNPPYRKIGTGSRHRACLRTAGLETVNLYTGFVGLALELLEEGGDLVAIIPRSFCNGPYYEPFRRFALERAALRHIHLFGARDKAFGDDGVLQENVIVRLTRGAQQGDVTVSSSSDDRFADYAEARHPFGSVVLPGDAAMFVHIPAPGAEGANAGDLLRGHAFRYRLGDLGVAVSTGPVVDFRMRGDTRAEPEPGTVPLLYPGHFGPAGVEWPKTGFRKPNAIRHVPETAKWLFPAGHYAVVRRFSSKEERRRVVASVLRPEDLPADASFVGFENHLNVVHRGKRPLDPDIARGVAAYLNSTAVDQYFRRFNGHTQVNAADLRALPYPSREAVLGLGRWALVHPGASQEAIDATVAALA